MGDFIYYGVIVTIILAGLTGFIPTCTMGPGDPAKNSIPEWIHEQIMGESDGDNTT